MHVRGFLHKTLSNVIHLKRLNALVQLVSAGITTKKISVTQLGRGIKGKIQERSAIRKSDRLIGNVNLHREKDQIYEKTLQLLIGNKKRPKILVDWSAIPNQKYYFLRAAMVAKGRALTLYEEVHSEKKLGNEKVQSQFLKKLENLLPDGCQPILITDAGFHTPWFEQVLNLGWDYVGRIRGTYKYSLDNGNSWQICKNLLKKATQIEESIGKVLLTRRKALPTYLYVFKEKLKGRKSKTREGKKKQDSHTKDYSRSAREPWLLASSLGNTHYLQAKRVVELYKTRMQIEEGFRDLKSSRYGLSFEQSYSKGIIRLENLLLIAMLASLIAWLIGWLGEQKQLHLKFQVNSTKSRRVLSLFFLGCQLIIKKIAISIRELFACINKGFSYDD